MADADGPRAALVQLRLSGRQKAVTLVVAVFVLAAVCSLVFGPGRGARDDLAEVRDDLGASRRGIAETVDIGRTNLARLTRQLRVTERSLTVQQRGLEVARESQQVARVGVRSTQRIETQTAETLSTLRDVIEALGPLQRLRGDVRTVVDGVEAGVSLARTTLGLARRTLADGRRALAVAVTTLETLQRSEQVQRDLLAVARATLEQVRQVNAKIPVPPVFPTQDPLPR